MKPQDKAVKFENPQGFSYVTHFLRVFIYSTSVLKLIKNNITVALS